MTISSAQSATTTCLIIIDTVVNARTTASSVA